MPPHTEVFRLGTSVEFGLVCRLPASAKIVLNFRVAAGKVATWSCPDTSLI